MPIQIFRHAHEPEELNELFEELFNKCDILLIEHATKEHRDRLRDYYNKMSLGKLSFSHFSSVFSGYDVKLDSFIKNSKKQIEVEDSPITRKEFEVWSNLSIVPCYLFCNGKFEEAIENELAYLLITCELTEKRDNNLTNQLIYLQKENKEKTILVPLGAGHTVHEKLKSRGLKVEEYFPYEPYILPLKDELILKRHNTGLNITQSTELNIVQSIPEGLFLTYLSEYSRLSYRKRCRISRRIAENLSYEDLESLSEYISRSDRKKEEPYIPALQWLKERKGLDLTQPTNL